MTCLDGLRSKIAQLGVDLVVLELGAQMTWLMHGRPHGDERPLFALVTQTHAGFPMPALEADADGPDAACEQVIVDFGLDRTHRYGLDAAMRADHAALVQDRLPETERHVTDGTTERHQPSYNTAKPRTFLAEGMVISTEPGIYRPGRIGVRLAEIVITPCKGAQIPSDRPQDFRVI